MRREETLIVGRIASHGRAPYQFREGESLSYYLKLATERGERLLWGTDLQRAIEKSATQPRVGDLVGARRAGREAVTLQARQGDPNTLPEGERDQLAYRNRWIVEKVEFLAERARLAKRVRESHLDARRAVKGKPELLSTFLSLRGAQEIAERRIANPQDRERFLALVREAMARSVHQGDPLPEVRMRNSTKNKPQDSAPVRGTRSDDERTR